MVLVDLDVLVHQTGNRSGHKVGPGACRQSAPAGAAQGIRGSAGAGAWPRWGRSGTRSDGSVTGQLPGLASADFTRSDDTTTGTAHTEA